MRNDLQLCTSELTRLELQRIEDSDKLSRLLPLLEELDVYPVTDEMQQLASAYIAAGVYAEEMRPDALHVAAATLLRQDVLLSWNFRHLVNRRRRAAVVQVNLDFGLRTPDILAPPEI